MGSVFSPYYAHARRKGGGLADPEQHVAINVALYGPKGRWAMTERGTRSLNRAQARFTVGPSAMRWEGDSLVVSVDEIAVPIPRRLRGTIRLTPSAITSQAFTLEPGGRHGWWPIAPVSRVEADFDAPNLRWSGPGYFDSNWGDEPLERRFQGWHWSRAAMPDGGAAILYDPTLLEGTATPLALKVDARGQITPFEAPPPRALSPCLWGVGRQTRCSPGGRAQVTQTLVDSPFYARSLIETDLGGTPVTAMHESLSLTRFDTRWVQVLLPFRMPRRG